MLTSTTREARGYFLLELTKTMIKKTEAANMVILEEILKEVIPDQSEKQTPFTKEEIIKRIKEKQTNKEKFEKIIEEPKKELKEEILKPLPELRSPLRKINFQTNKPRILRIPEPRLPENLEYLKPSITPEPININELNPLLKDPNVFEIESPGHNQQVKVTGTMGRKNTNIILNQNQIDDILEVFSKKAKIPISVGITRIVVGNLMLTSILTAEGTTQFKIQKIRNVSQRLSPRY